MSGSQVGAPIHAPSHIAARATAGYADEAYPNRITDPRPIDCRYLAVVDPVDTVCQNDRRSRIWHRFTAILQTLPNPFDFGYGALADSAQSANRIGRSRSGRCRDNGAGDCKDYR
ncbi:hypothetical protein SPHINGO361_110153 [Sphingomonas sp. EC-HK361]|nr:hypothetical protein SPHINGO361_110153 [Sphingomonas sp. EC-HK361]